jgi:hypothetical protein
MAANVVCTPRLCEIKKSERSLFNFMANSFILSNVQNYAKLVFAICTIRQMYLFMIKIVP